jgi:hypothetical protein
MTGPIFPLALWAILRGPRVPSDVTARDVLAAHLDWVRRTRRASRSPRAEDEARSEEIEPLPDDRTRAEERVALEPAEALEVVASAAVELGQLWQADVLATVPSQLLFGLCGVGDRAVYLLEEAAPDLASRFARLRDAFMLHSQGGQPMSDDDLGRAVDELASLIPAVAERALEIHAAVSPKQ